MVNRHWKEVKDLGDKIGYGELMTVASSNIEKHGSNFIEQINYLYLVKKRSYINERLI